MNKERLAIIGSGIAGMGAAYLLNKHYDITVFEKNNYVGGHTNTLTVDENGKDIFIDTGFMVFNKVTYPNLTRLFNELDVPVKPTKMSFSVNNVKSGLEYNGSGLSGLFSQRRNFLNARFIKMLIQINRFNKECLEVLNDSAYATYTLKEYVDEKGFGKDLTNLYLVPMSSAVWSTPPDKMLQFPASTLIRFFYNHGFLGLNTQHQWYTVVDGSRTYREKITNAFRDKIYVDAGARKIIRQNDKIRVITENGQDELFDKVIIAAHADQALEMLDNPTNTESELLSKFKYQENKATLHTDESVMPKNRKVWSSWNYRIQEINNQPETSTIYYMNSLQGVSKYQNYFVSIDDPGNIAPNSIMKEIDYTHPVFSLDAINAQNDLHKLNDQNNNTYFCGSYFKYGFHEDAFTSAIELSRKLMGDSIWK